MPELFELQAASSKASQAGKRMYYDALPAANNSTHLAARGGLKQTIEIIAQVTRATLSQTKELAKKLYSADKYTAASNVWSWTKQNISYHLDTPGSEQIRTPARSFADRLTGVDCEDMAIFTASLLINMGYRPHYAIVAFNGKENYGHIYTMLDNTVVDCVWTKFDEHPPHITKTLKHDPMDIKVLSGTSEDCINGLGAIAPATATTKKLLQGQGQLLALHKQATGTDKHALACEIRKTHYMVNLNATAYQAKMLHVMPALQDVTDEGEFVFKANANLEDIADYLNDTTLSYEYHNELDGLAGNWLKDTMDKVKSGVKNVADKAKEVIDKVKKPLLKVMPIAVLCRNAFLLLVKLNVRNIAKGFSVGYYTPAEAKSKNISEAVHQRCVAGVKKMEQKFEKFGGEAKNFKHAVEKGAKHKALLGKSKSTKGLKGWGNDMPDYYSGSHSSAGNMPFSTAHTNYNANTRRGLGEPVTISVSAALAAAAPLIAALSKILKDMKPSDAGGEYDAEAELDNLKAEDLSADEAAAFAQELPNTPDPLADDKDEKKSTDDKDGKIFGLSPVVAGAGALAIGYFMFNGKKAS